MIFKESNPKNDKYSEYHFESLPATLIPPK